MDFDARSTIQVTTFPGLSDIVAAEIDRLGMKVVAAHKSGVETAGTLADCQRLCLHLRTALNVLYLLKDFEATSPDELYKRVREIPWEDIVSPAETLSVVSRVDTPSVDNTMFASLRVKDAIVDRITEAAGARPDSGKERTGVVVQLHWRESRAWVFLNASGTKLSDRGYRKMPHKAPLREVLAAGILQTALYCGERPLVLPMCGSGTLAIEAALLALGRAPGLLRSDYGFTHVLGFERERWTKMRDAARRAGARKLSAPIIATDVDGEAVFAARRNAATAGVDHLIDFAVSDFAETDVPEGGGIVIVNPEYGRRMGQIKKLEATYARLGDFFKERCVGYTCYIFTGNMELAKKVGLRASRRFPFQNGKIECRLLKYDIYAGSRQEDRKKR